MSQGPPRPTVLEVLLLGLVAVAFFVPMPNGRALDAAEDLAHAPIFAALTAWLALRFVSTRLRSLVLVVLVAGAVGVLIEGLQSVTGRDASVADALADLAGAVAGALLAAARTARRGRLALVGGALLSLSLPSFLPGMELLDCLEQRRAWPELASFETRRELGRWDGTDAVFDRSPDHATDGRSALRVELRPGPYPGIGLVWPPADWSRYALLRLDVFVEGTEPLDLRLKIEDRSHNGELSDRFQRSFHLSPGPHRIEVPLSEVEAGPRGRRLDLRAIAQVRVFAADLGEPRIFYLDDVRLVPAG